MKDTVDGLRTPAPVDNAKYPSIYRVLNKHPKRWFSSTNISA